MQPQRSQSLLPPNSPFSTAVAVVLACVLVGARSVIAQVNVLTYHNDNLRTGVNLNETTLTPGNVNQGLFGLLFSCAVDGQVYAQPLYRSNVSFPNGSTHNVVFVATQHDGVYAFDANGPDQCGDPLWYHSFLDPDNGITSIPQPELGQPPDITPELGITSTPVIDPAAGPNGTLFVVAKTKEVRANAGECQTDTCRHYVQTLHALDITTGADTLPPTVIGDTVNPTGQGGNNAYGYVVGICVPGKGNGTILDPDGNNIVCFNAMREHERSGLVVSRGVVYLAWASHTDTGPYHGWVMGFDEGTLQPISGSVFNTSPNGGLGGIWMGGGAPAVDPNDGSIYFSTGNGTFAIDPADSCTHSSAPCNPAYGDTVLKLGVSPDDRSLSLTDYFTPFNQLSLDNTDADLASGGVLLVPDNLAGSHPHLLITAGKEGKIYSVDRDDLGAYRRCGAMCDDVVAFTPSGTVAGQAADTPAYLNTGTERRVYYVGSGDVLKVFTLNDAGHLDMVAQGTQRFTGSNSKGATVSISGSIADDGSVFNAIAWATQSGGGVTEVGVLRAYDALAGGTLSELYDSNQAGLRDRLGVGMKFSVPTVANGHVYVGTGMGPANTACASAPGCLDVFGLFP